jgi:hypothetical protein
VELQQQMTATAGAAQMKPDCTFLLKLPSAAPTGMTGVTKPFRLSEIKVNSVHAFA